MTIQPTSDDEQPRPAPKLTGRPIVDILTELTDQLDRYEQYPSAPTQRDRARRIVPLTRELLAALHLRAYPADTESDASEQVVVTLFEVDLSIRYREGDLFVHVDTDERDPDDAAAYPLVVEVNNGGENAYT